MKTIFLTVSALLCATLGFSQDDSVVVSTDAPPAVVQTQDSIVNLYKKEDLALLKKVDLTKIYLSQVTQIIYMIGKTSIKEGDVPVNRYTENHWKLLNKSSDRNNAVIEEKYKNIVPYSDRDDIIDSILFFQNIINQMGRI